MDDSTIYDIKRKILAKYPRFGDILARVNIEFKNDLPGHTAATDGKNIYFDQNYFASLSESEKLYLIAHEILHIKFLHFLRLKDKNGKKRDFEAWNIATDAVINANLERDGFTIKEGDINIPNALNYSAEELYEIILQEKEKKKQEQQQNQSGDGQNQNENGQEQENDQNQGQSENGQNQNENGQEQENDKDQSQSENGQNQNENGQEQENDKDQGQSENWQNQDENGQKPGDDHSLWEEAFKNREQNKKEDEEKQKNQKDKNNKKNQESQKNKKDKKNQEDQKDKNNQKNQEDKKDKKDKKDQKNQNDSEEEPEAAEEQEFEIDEKDEFKKNREEKIKRFKERRKKTEGNIRGISEEVKLDNIGKSKEEIDWKLLLRREVEKTETIWTQRRSIAENNYAYRLEENDIEDEAETEIMIDVSGSVELDLVKAFLRQIKPLLKQSKLRVGCFDVQFFDFIDIKNERDIDRFSIPAGAGGGTDLDLPVRCFSKKREINKIIFTDGYGRMPKDDLKKENIIWLVYGKEDFDPCCGKVINITEKQLEQLHLINKDVSKEDMTR